MISIKLRSQAKPRDLARAIRVLRDGGIIIYPTETAYALGCDATNPRAVSRVFRLKGRESSKTLPLIAASAAMVWRYAKKVPIGTFMIEQFWPGPLTVVSAAKLRSNRSLAAVRLAKGVVTSDGTIALRVSGSPAARALSQGLGRPIVATSANRSGDPPAYTVTDALKGLHGTPDLVLDAGRLPRRKPSTIVRIDRGRVKILRQGDRYVPPHR